MCLSSPESETSPRDKLARGSVLKLTFRTPSHESMIQICASFPGSDYFVLLNTWDLQMFYAIF